VRVAPPLDISPGERAQLDRLVADPSIPARTQLRAWIVLRAAAGAKNRSIAREFLVDVDTVGLWRRRFLVHRVPGIIADAPRSGRKPKIPASLVARIVSASRQPPGPGALAPSSREIARGMKVSQSTVVRIWRTHQLRSTAGAAPEPPGGAALVRGVRDIRGVYLIGDDRAVVFVASRHPEEALGGREEAAPGSAVAGGAPAGSRGPSGRRSRDPLAALRVLYRATLTDPGTPDRVQEFLIFLRGIHLGLAPDEEAHLVLSSVRLAKEPEVLRWLRRHSGFLLYATAPGPDGRPPELVLPDGLSLRPGRSGSLRSLPGLVEAFRQYLSTFESRPRPFVWQTPGSTGGFWPAEAPAAGPKLTALRAPGLVPLPRSPVVLGPSPAPAPPPGLWFPTVPSALSGGYRNAVDLHSGVFPPWLKPAMAPAPPPPLPDSPRPATSAGLGSQSGARVGAQTYPAFAPFLLGGRVGRPPNRLGNESK
jgi:hypothetical protein